MTKSFDRYITYSSANYMRKQCNPLKLSGIIGFHHDISFPMGEISMLTTEEGIFKHWFKNRIPAICTDESGRFLNSGVYLDTYLKDKCADYVKLEPQFLSLFNANRTLHIVERENDCQHFYSFAFQQTQEREFLHFVMNNLNRLQNFIGTYRAESIELINEAKKPINRILLPIDSCESQTSPFLQIKSDMLNQHVFHRETKIPIYLSKQQSLCLVLLMQGKTAKYVAGKLNLSYRTVQHYFERIRKILGCASNKELIIAYGDQVISEGWDALRKSLE